MKKLHNSTFSFKGLSGTKKLLTAILLLLSYGSFAQYCTPGTWGGNSCSAAGNIYITTAKLSGTTFYSGGTCGSATGYNNLTGSVTCNVTAGQTYTIFLQSFDATSAYGTSFGAWMDFNGNQVYTDAGEAIIAPSAGNYIAAGGSLSITSASFTVPSGASGTTRMRVGVYGGQFGYGGVAMPCSASASYYGEYKDFTLIITPGTPCSGTPASLVVSPTAPSICSAASTNIALTLDASGYTYQWQQSNASNGTYVNVTGGSNATTATYTTPTGGSLPYSPTYYRCNVTCTASGQTTASQISTVSLNSFLNCYCSVSYAAANGGTRGIVQVILNGTPNINNSTAVNSVSPYYTQYTAASPVSNAGLSLSTSYALQVKVGTQANAINNVGAWIDYDQNGVFSSSEFIGSFTNAAASSTTTINFTVPGTASTGTTAMRIRHRYGAAVASTDACTAFSGAVGGGGSGETEDYRVNITGAACSATPTAGTVSASPTTVCPNATSVISLSGYTNGVSGITFQWQVSVNGGSYSNVSGGSGGTTATYTTSGLSNATLTSATYTYQCVVTCTNSGLSATSTTATVTVNPTPSVSVSPSSATICNSTGSQSLAASNAASGSTTYTWSPTTGLSPTSGSPVTASPSTTTTYTVT